jgi:hypothetical protein
MRIPAKVIVGASAMLGRVPAFATRVRRPHFIVSTGRAGTTMLNAVFDRHPEVANFPSEANELWHPRLYPWADSAVDAPPYWLDPAEFTRRSLAQQTLADARHLQATFGAFQALTRAPVLLVKTVMVSFMLERVLELFPDARFIHLYRDGRAVAASWMVKDRAKLHSAKARAMGLAFDDDALLERYATYWNLVVAELQRAEARHRLRARDRWHDLSYEALCADPAAALTALAGFIGVAPEPLLGSELAAIRNTNHKARAQLSSVAVARLSTLARPGLSTLGYDQQQIH